MDYVELACPSCGAPLGGIEKRGCITCEYCDSVIMIRSRDLNGDGTLTVNDTATGLELAYVRIPFGWQLKGSLSNIVQSYQYPFTVTIDASNDDTSTIIHYQSGVGFSDQGASFMQKFNEGKIDPTAKIRYRRFIGTGNYLDSYVASVYQASGVALQHVEDRPFPIYEPIDEEASKQHITAKAQAEIDRQSADGFTFSIDEVFFNALTRIYTFEKDGQRYKIAAATVLEGVKWSMLGNLAGAGNLLGSLFGKSGGDASSTNAPLFGNSGNGSLFEKTYIGKKLKSGQLDSWIDKTRGTAFGDTLGNLVGGMQKNGTNETGNTNIPLTETEEEAAFATRGGFDVFSKMIDWESRHTFMMQARAEVFEQEYETAFIDFCSTLHLNPMLEQRRYQMQDQILQDIRRKGAEQQAASNRQFAAWQQQHAAQTAAFDSYNKSWWDRTNSSDAARRSSYQSRLASEDRIREQRSEAIRGVNTYYRPDGSEVELSCGYDTAWTNNRGDVIGGSAGADYGADWTKMDRKY